MRDNKEIPEIEKKIYDKIDYSNKRLKIRAKYIDDGTETRTFTVNEVNTIFKQMAVPYEYLGRGFHRLEVKSYKDYKVIYDFVIVQNAINTYIYIYKKDELIAPKITNAGSVLKYIGYDKELADKLNKTFGINSFEDLKNYILENKSLYDEFVNEYFMEIEAENI